MRDYLISSYIDDELDLDEKIEFVETVHAEAPFKDEAVDLLLQEKLLRGKVTDRMPSVTLQPGRRRALSWWRPVGMFAAGLATLGSSALIHAVTLPTEFDASFNRALPMLDEHRILKSPDRPHAHKLLRAAALTYVSASLMSLLNIARWWAILRR